MKLHLTWPLSIVAAAVVLAGCSSGASGSTEESSASGSADETSAAAAATPSPELQKAADDYKAYTVAQSDELVKVVKVFTDAVRAGNLKAAQDAFAPSRQPWERIEPIAELVEDTDAKTDSRVDDFASADDPAFTGWHRLEYLLFEKNTTDGGAQFADQLDADIANLHKQLPGVEVKPIDVANGAAELIEEVSEGKLTGEEDRYSKTDLWDFDANLQGSQVAVDKLSGPLEKADAELLGKISAGFSQLFDTMRPLRQGDGWVNYCIQNSEFPSPRCPSVTVPPETVDALKAQLAGLSENLSQIAGALKLQ
ncbi:EfeM/EfeO family lipoprotein [Mycolicibacterium moriokaense]|nr:EfeM/EfeO family lipoprotein [Mycolicibacterium moriokaense]